MDIEFPRHQIAGDNSPRLPIDHNQVQHFCTRNHRHGPGMNLAFERLVGTQKKLLTCLAPCIEGARYLRTAERAIRQRSTIFACKWNTLGDALIDDVIADFRQPIDIAFACAKVPALHRVIKKPVNALAIVGIVFCRVDAALRSDGVCTTGRVLEAKAFDVIAQLAERRRCGGSCQAGTDHDQGMLALIGRIDQLHIEAGLGPCLFNRAGRDSCVECHVISRAPAKC